MSAGHTLVQYGNVSLYHVTTESISQEPMWDDSGTDLLYMKTTIKVSGFVHGHYEWFYQTQSANDGLNYGGSAADAEIAVRKILGPRQTFGMWNGCSGEGQLPDGQMQHYVSAAPSRMVPPGPNGTANINLAGIDLNNGPRNTSWEVTQVAGNEVFRVSATFEICQLECKYPGTANSFGVLSNRWSCADALDVDNQVVRTYNGTLVCASANINIQSFRWFTVPPLQPLMRLDSMSFVVSEDGLKLNWTVVHKEVASAAPYPARSWSLEHTEEYTSGMKGVSHVDVELTGQTDVDKSRLITLAYWLIFAKTFGKTPDAIAALNDGGAFQKQFIVQSIQVTDHAGEKNRISARAKVQRLGNQSNNQTVAFGLLGAAIVVGDLPAPQGTEPLYQQSLSWGAYPDQVPEIQGPAKLAGIFACYLQYPCNNNHATYVCGQTSPGNSVDQNATALACPVPQIPVPSRVVVTNNFTAFSYYSSSQTTAIYTFWQIDNLYRTKKMRAQMPIASAPVSGPNYSPGSVFVQFAAPQTKRIIRVSAERVGQEPEFPDPENLPPFPIPSGLSGTQGITQVCLDVRIKPGTPIITVLGQKLFRADAEYLIGFSRAPNAGEQLALGNDKWTNFGDQSTDVSGALTNSDWT